MKIKKRMEGRGVKSIHGLMIYESVCNQMHCYNDAINYGFCSEHIKGKTKDKNGEWNHETK